MAIDITIELDDKALDAALDRAIKGGANLRQPMGGIADEWEGLVKQRFADEKDPLGVPWAKRRDNADPDRKVLKLTGDLERAVVTEFGQDYAQIGVLETGPAAKYARIHNAGGTIVPKEKKALSFGGRLVARVVMPKRQFVGFGPGEQRTVEGIMGGFLAGVLAGDPA